MKYLNILALFIVVGACHAQPTKPETTLTAIPDTATLIAQADSVQPILDSSSLEDHTTGFDNTFYFSIKTNGSGYDSKTGKFWRMYSGGEIRYYDITLTMEEMKAVYNAIEDAEFSSFPNKFESQSDTINEVEPNFYYIISSNVGGKNHEVYYSDASTDRAMREAGKPFLALYSTIYHIVESNADVKKIPESNIGWE